MAQVQAPQGKKIIVTGCNKGLGYGIVEGLCKQEVIPTVIMACRNEGRANTAKESLEAKYPAAKGKLVICGTLDVGDFTSCDAFVSGIQAKFGKVDCLLNNAGISIVNKDPKTKEEAARETCQVNYFGTAYLTKKMLPLIVDNGKVLFTTSQVGKVGRLSKKLQTQLLDPNVGEEKINELAEEYFTSYREGSKPEDFGWPDFIYGNSKIFIQCWCKWWAQQEPVLSRGIQVYSFCPGYVKTVMCSKGKRTLEEGSVTPLWLINLPWKMDKEKQGKFFVDCKIQDLDSNNFIF